MTDSQAGGRWAGQLSPERLKWLTTGLPELERLVTSIASERRDPPAVREASRKQRAEEREQRTEEFKELAGGQRERLG